MRAPRCVPPATDLYTHASLGLGFLLFVRPRARRSEFGPKLRTLGSKIRDKADRSLVLVQPWIPNAGRRCASAAANVAAADASNAGHPREASTQSRPHNRHPLHGLWEHSIRKCLAERARNLYVSASATRTARGTHIAVGCAGARCLLSLIAGTVRMDGDGDSLAIAN